jgi:peptidoglycan-associated lipoprotein
MKSNSSLALLIATLCVSLVACHKQVAAVQPPAPAPVVASTIPAAVHNTPSAVAVAAKSYSNTPDAATKQRIQDLLNRIQDAYFDYDKQALRPDAEIALQSDAKMLTQVLSQYPDYKLTVEGFCDERGSDEYNLALGDERAKRTEEFLVTLGLPSSQLRTVSYGKERPVCTEHDEACWQKNRRTHITQDQKSS